MRNHTVRTTKAASRTGEVGRRRWLGLAMLVLTLSGGYAVAHLEVVPTPGALVAYAEDVADVVGASEAFEASETLEMERPRPTTAEILAHIEEVAARHRVDPRLVAAIVAVESEFNPRAVSRRGAQGLMQLMPATAASLDVEDSFDIQENLDGGVRHLRVLMQRYHNDLPLVLAAYNAGDRAVIAYRGVPPYPQTRRYVVRVLRRYDPEAARAAAARIYGRRPTIVRVAALDVAPPSIRPLVLGPWRDSATPRVENAARMDSGGRPEHGPTYGSNSP